MTRKALVLALVGSIGLGTLVATAGDVSRLERPKPPERASVTPGPPVRATGAHSERFLRVDGWPEAYRPVWWRSS